MLECFFNKLQAWGPKFLKKRLQHRYFSSEISEIRAFMKNIDEPLLLYLQVILFTMHEKDTANET